MGNSSSKEERKDLKLSLNELLKINLPLLNIGEKKGLTGYIDFINPNDINENAMNGYDSSNRYFIVFKSTVFFEDGTKENYFTTFFKRYYDNDLLYHTAGNNGKLLFETVGGAKTYQILFLCKLLENGEVNGNDIIPLNENLEEDIEMSAKPISVKLGWF